MSITRHFSGYKEQQAGGKIGQSQVNVRPAPEVFKRQHEHAQALAGGEKKEATSATVFGYGALIVVGGMFMGRMMKENMQLAQEAREINAIVDQPFRGKMAENNGKQQDLSLAGIILGVLLVAYAGYRLLKAIVPSLEKSE